MMKKTGFTLLLVFIGSVQASAQDITLNTLRIAFWNVENFFDPKKDSLKEDSDFTPSGLYRWNYTRFHEKKNHLYKTIYALSEGNMPIIIGLCEIENQWVLEELCRNTPLAKYNYQFIHYESADTRGIDVALLYSPECFSPISSYPVSIQFPDDSVTKTRDLLFVKGRVFEKDTIGLFVVHFPSKRGGGKSDKRRKQVAAQLKKEVSSVMEEEIPVLIMGDFNEDAHSSLLKELLETSVHPEELKTKKLYNLMSGKLNAEGSYKYKGRWSTIDQIIISKQLYDGGKLKAVNQTAFIFNPDFLKMPDKKYMGIKPFRTYNGIQYIGGYSDHFPVYVDIQKIK